MILNALIIGCDLLIFCRRFCVLLSVKLSIRGASDWSVFVRVTEDVLICTLMDVWCNKGSFFLSGVDIKSLTLLLINKLLIGCLMAGGPGVVR